MMFASLSGYTRLMSKTNCLVKLQYFLFFDFWGSIQRNTKWPVSLTAWGSTWKARWVSGAIDSNRKNLWHMLLKAARLGHFLDSPTLALWAGKTVVLSDYWDTLGCLEAINIWSSALQISNGTCILWNTLIIWFVCHSLWYYIIFKFSY